MTDKLLIEALEEMRDTLVKVLIKIRRDAPDLSGKLLGAADQIVARVDALLDAAPPAPAPTAASEREALIERLKAQSLAHRYEAETDSADLIDEAIAALRSTERPDGEAVCPDPKRCTAVVDCVNGRVSTKSCTTGKALIDRGGSSDGERDYYECPDCGKQITADYREN